MAKLQVTIKSKPPLSALAGDVKKVVVKVGRTPAGAAGLSAYELAVQNGFSGTLEDWLESLHANSSAVTVTAEQLISQDTDNNLQLGSDNKLLSQPKDIDFLADYILASN